MGKVLEMLFTLPSGVARTTCSVLSEPLAPARFSITTVRPLAGSSERGSGPGLQRLLQHGGSAPHGVLSVSPPSTTISAPVTYFASSDARYSAA